MAARVLVAGIVFDLTAASDNGSSTIIYRNTRFGDSDGLFARSTLKNTFSSASYRRICTRALVIDRLRELYWRGRKNDYFRRLSNSLNRRRSTFVAHSKLPAVVLSPSVAVLELVYRNCFRAVGYGVFGRGPELPPCVVKTICRTYGTTETFLFYVRNAVNEMCDQRRREQVPYFTKPPLSWMLPRLDGENANSRSRGTNSA